MRRVRFSHKPHPQRAIRRVFAGHHCYRQMLEAGLMPINAIGSSVTTGAFGLPRDFGSSVLSGTVNDLPAQGPKLEDAW
jgi:hypothetical protein